MNILKIEKKRKNIKDIEMNDEVKAQLITKTLQRIIETATEDCDIETRIRILRSIEIYCSIDSKLEDQQAKKIQQELEDEAEKY